MPQGNVAEGYGYFIIQAFTKEAAERLAKGEAVTTPRFMTTSSKYAWLNNVQAIGTARKSIRDAKPTSSELR